MVLLFRTGELVAAIDGADREAGGGELPVNLKAWSVA